MVDRFFQSCLLDEEGQLPRLDRAMTTDAVGSLARALFGPSTVTSYIESSAGVSVGPAPACRR